MIMRMMAMMIKVMLSVKMLIIIKNMTMPDEDDQNEV